MSPFDPPHSTPFARQTSHHGMSVSMTRIAAADDTPVTAPPRSWRAAFSRLVFVDLNMGTCSGWIVAERAEVQYPCRRRETGCRQMNRTPGWTSYGGPSRPV